MSAQLMIFAKVKSDNIFKGVIIEVRDDIPVGAHWLPNMVVVNITDVTKAQVAHYMQPWVREFTHEILAENEDGWRIKLSVHPNITSALGLDKAFAIDFRDYLISAWGAQLFEWDSINHTYAIFDFPKPIMFEGIEKTLVDLRADVVDKTMRKVAYRRYIFTESDVDAVITAGGYVNRTAEQILAVVVDRLS